ncbi:MAG: uncharacterized protein KVP18_005059 [Porospora cf. gigantea A]|uniref:uncharacterized protein n=1 Tax=Porospora cf. gigantea A TaxID=2853593 RepID=UPI0035594903|nr:MAG: hypothetical protein KVP18_005059 [Porospora cf. gigantea A]
MLNLPACESNPYWRRDMRELIGCKRPHRPPLVHTRRPPWGYENRSGPDVRCSLSLAMLQAKTVRYYERRIKRRRIMLQGTPPDYSLAKNLPLVYCTDLDYDRYATMASIRWYQQVFNFEAFDEAEREDMSDMVTVTGDQTDSEDVAFEQSVLLNKAGLGEVVKPKPPSEGQATLHEDWLT